MRSLTTEQADTVNNVKKFTFEHVRWDKFGATQSRLRARVGFEELPDFLVGQNFDLFLVGNIGRKNHGFSLMLNNLIVRRYENGSPHTNPDGKKVEGFHKHFWTFEYGDADTYIPSDIDPNTTINEQFYAFCQECNIDIRGGYQAILPGERS